MIPEMRLRTPICDHETCWTEYSRMTENNDSDGFGLLSENLEVDEIIDLQGLSAEMACQKALNSIAETKISKIWFRFDLADGGGPTLFAPIGKLLREELKAARIIRAMPASKGGWIVRLK